MGKPFSANSVCIGVVVALLSSGWPVVLRAQDKAEHDLPEAEGREVVIKRCGRCHSLQHIPNAGKQTRDFWRGTVEEMYLEAGWSEDEDFEIIVNYLAKHFGTAEEKGASAPALAPCASVHARRRAPPLSSPSNSEGFWSRDLAISALPNHQGQ